MNYRDKFYEKYISTHTGQLYGDLGLGAIRRQFPIWQKYFGKFLPKEKSAKIGDFGCGNGGFVWWLQQKGFDQTEGIDVSSEQVAAAEKMGIKNIQRSDIYEFLKKKTDFYDVVFMKDVLEHQTKEEVLNILELISRSLKKGGVLVIQTANAESPFWGRIRHGDFTHETSFTKNSVSQLLSIFGFKNIEVFPMGPVVHGIRSFVRFVLWQLIVFIVRFYLLIETGSPSGIFTQNIIVSSVNGSSRHGL
ncbi:MAG: hypothetical protein UY23_C0001G0096 [Candidatus Jorgensenbacteria bacterium GW2011_GWA1_48_11]|uniref:Methyltransferase type 11 n=1 Tax=Candidatus Jorgensenbacteria bacterium GW2011_GWA1_48_11 TaxID=1618660 RepID=A0A0G1XAX5_9BACT|nr:MAG: hypothetical protein UY23_C0001G0096 [Candidatus Jorgensenbacteria bacterium GW2011_GWA1_48_11]KKW11983.1 MAG: hypothetical protein UY51_C0005G0225 [Candidatus Jorgensenbacteria bacterium GW2011_GWB1_49_9]